MLNKCELLSLPGQKSYWSLKELIVTSVIIKVRKFPYVIKLVLSYKDKSVFCHFYIMDCLLPLQVKNAMLAGAKGIILYSDPADYSAPGVEPYPKGWNLPGTVAQRGNVLNLDGAGDPLTPGYPAKGNRWACYGPLIFAKILLVLTEGVKVSIYRIPLKLCTIVFWIATARNLKEFPFYYFSFKFPWGVDVEGVVDSSVPFCL